MSLFYDLADLHPKHSKTLLAAVRTGEMRPPKKGEWYLSGAIPEAYRAKSNMSTPYHIVRIAEIEKRTVTKLVRYV